MSSINLKKFISKKAIANNINGVIRLADDFVCVMDVNDNVIIAGDGDKKACLQHEIRLVDKVVGWVIGGDNSAVIASLITTLIQKEHENNELAREVLNGYKELALLQNTAEKITSNLTLQEVCNLIITEALNKIPATSVSVMIMNKETGLLEAVLAKGHVYKNKLRMKAGEGIAGNIFINGKAEIINDVSSDPRFIKNDQKMSSMMCAPLRTGNNVFGVMNISSEEPKSYTSAELKLFDTLALHGALAIANARYNKKLTNHRDHLETIVEKRTSDLAMANEELTKKIEERKRTEIRIKDAKNESEAANQAKSLFLTTMSHELRTPLNAIIGYSNILKNDSNMKRESQKVLSTIEKSGNNLLDIVNDLLDISKIEANRMEFEPGTFNLVDLINYLNNLFKLKCDQKGLDLQVEISFNNENMFVNGDSKKLRQVLIYLLSNAVKFTESGYVRLSVKMERENNFLFSVKDTGHGIDLNSQIDIFEPFRQTESGISKGGAGLGLAISSKQIEIMGGKLTVKSEINMGSCFFFSLKLKSANGREIEKFTNNSLPPLKKVDLGGRLKTRSGLRALVVDKDKTSSNILSGVRALVVDKDKTSRNILSKMLIDVGVKTDETGKYKDILKKIQKEPPDLAFINSKVLGKDAGEILKTIKSECADKTKAVIISDSIKIDDEKNLEEADYDYMITKPFKVESVYNCLGDVFDVDDSKKKVGENVDIVRDNIEVSSSLDKEVKTVSVMQLSHNIDEELILRIKNAAEFYKVTELENCLNDIEKLGSEPAVFAREIRNFVEHYDMKGILNALES